MTGAARLLIASFSPRAAQACAVCFGFSEDQAGLASGLLWGLGILLSFTFLGIAGLTAAVIRVEKNRASAESKP